MGVVGERDGDCELALDAMIGAARELLLFVALDAFTVPGSLLDDFFQNASPVLRGCCVGVLLLA